MKKFYHRALVSVPCAMLLAQAAQAAHYSEKFKHEVLEGLDIRATLQTPGFKAPGTLGHEVYKTADAGESDELNTYVPTSMYVRGGVGYTFGWMSGHAESSFGSAEIRDGHSVQIGLGWNLSKIARAEIDFQFNKFRFDKETAWAIYPTDLSASSTEIGGIVYFDLRKKYIATGDIVRKRTVVPFVGLGIGVGRFSFNNALSNIGPGIWIEGNVGTFVAPRAEVGLNFGITESLGLDFTYQYQMKFSHGFGWGPNLPSGLTSVSNIISSLRFNF